MSAPTSQERTPVGPRFTPRERLAQMAKLAKMIEELDYGTIEIAKQAGEIVNVKRTETFKL